MAQLHSLDTIHLSVIAASPAMYEAYARLLQHPQVMIRPVEVTRIVPALELASEDVVLVDLTLSEINGFQLAASIRRQVPLALVICTGFDTEFRETAAELGFPFISPQDLTGQAILDMVRGARDK